MKGFPLGKSKELRDTYKGKHEGILLHYKDLLHRYKQTLERYMQNLPPTQEPRREGHMSTSQLSQLKDQNERILLLLEELKNRESEIMSELDNNILNSSKKIVEQMDNLLATNIETNYKLDELDKRVVSNVTANFVELQKQLLYQLNEKQAQLFESNQILHRKIRTNRVLLWILIIFQTIGLGALAFIILYLLGYIYF
ncbi:MAG: hypothetical protein GX321_07315 [Clostridiales bacterium]|nr:hypothetical protein [Clostridiales bacterium]